MRFAQVTLVSVLALSCATTSGVTSSAPESWDAWPAPAPPVVEATPIEPPSFVGHQVATRAGALVGVSLRQAAPDLPDDCTGLVRAAWRAVNVELMGHARAHDSGVEAIWHLAEDVGALVPPCPPGGCPIEPGDILFFRETYDRNRNGKLDDGLTHVAIVEQVEPDGTITYVHRAGPGVVRAKLNLGVTGVKNEAGSAVNDWLRPKSRQSPAALGVELFAGAARARVLGAPSLEAGRQ